MKKSYSLFIILTCLISCNDLFYSYDTEDRIYDCYVQEYKRSGIDPELILNRVETVLIKYKIITDKSPRSYINFFKNERNFDFLDNEELKEELIKLEPIPSQISCSDTSIIYDSDVIKNSRYFRFLNSVSSEILSCGDINFKIIKDVVLKEVNKRDFKHKLFKTVFLISITNFIIHDSNFKRKLPPIKNEYEQKAKLSDRNILIVYIDTASNIFIDNKLVPIHEVCATVKEFLVNPKNDTDLSEHFEIILPKVGRLKVSKGIINLQTDRNTSYKIYLQVQNETVRAVNELRDEFALKHFKNKFDDLSDEDQDIVSEIFPMNITESEPRRMINNNSEIH